MASNPASPFSSESSDVFEREITLSEQNITYIRGLDLQNHDNYVITAHYTWWNFPFKNLYQQFCNKANLYFLFIGLLQIIPAISTTNGTPTIYVPLTFIVLVSATRAAIEDRQKHIADAQRNNSKYERVRFTKTDQAMLQAQASSGEVPRTQREALLNRGSGGDSELEETTSGELKCGDIVKVYKDQMVPCDMILLSSSEEKGHCFIDKANLNGETSLEVMMSIPALRKYCTDHGNRFGDLSLELDWEAPSSNFEQFRCRFILREPQNQTTEIPVNHKNLMLRETVLRNTEYVYGLTVYTGDDTKIRRSIAEGEKPGVKTSRIMMLVDGYIMMMFGVLGILCLLGGVYSGTWQATRAEKHWYLDLKVTNWGGVTAVFASTGSWLILLSAMVPISLVVSAQVVKFIQSYFIACDLRLWSAATQKSARCNTSTIHEDLGLVDFIFSDKTGTLTQNKMDFRYAYIAVREEGQQQQQQQHRDQVVDFATYGSTDTDIARAVKAKQRAALKNQRKHNIEHKDDPVTEGEDIEEEKQQVWTNLVQSEVDEAYEFNKIKYREKDEKTRTRSCCEKMGLSRFWHTTEGYYRGIYSSFPVKAIEYVLGHTPTSDSARNASLTLVSSADTIVRSEDSGIKFSGLPSFTRRLVAGLIDHVRTHVLGLTKSSSDDSLSAPLAKIQSVPSSPRTQDNVGGYVAPPISPSASSQSSPTSPVSPASASSSTLGTASAGMNLPMAPGSSDYIYETESKTVPAVDGSFVQVSQLHAKWLGSFEKEERLRLMHVIWGHLWPASSSSVASPAQRAAAMRYLRHMALSSTTKPYYTPQQELDWQFESAEELAMVRFAAACGFIKETDPNTGAIVLKIVEFRTPDLVISPETARVRVERYHQIATFGFSSRRARVTLVWQRVDSTDPLQEGKIHIMCKGQDTMVLPLLHNPVADQAQAGGDLMGELSDMCAKGLRTLIACYAETTPAWWQNWGELYQKVTEMDELASSAVVQEVSNQITAVSNTLAESSGSSIDKTHETPSNVKRLREDLYEAVEKRAMLKLLGCIGMEDKLQHFVPEAIADFARAGIKVWMITGDKLETARNIALACNLIDTDMTEEERLVEVTGEWAGIGQDPVRLRALFEALVDVKQKGDRRISLSNISTTAATTEHTTSAVEGQIATGEDLAEEPTLTRSASTTVSLRDVRTAFEQQNIPLPRRIARILPDERSVGVSPESGLLSPTAAADAALDADQVDFDTFVSLMTETKWSLYDAVRTQVDLGLSRYLALTRGALNENDQKAPMVSDQDIRQLEQQLQAASASPNQSYMDKQFVASHMQSRQATASRSSRYATLESDEDHANIPAELIFGSNTAPPIAMLVNRDAFRLMFPGKSATSAASSMDSFGSSSNRSASNNASAPLSPSMSHHHQQQQQSEPTEEQIEELKRRFFMLASVCKSVVFARAEPAMKKKMVTEMTARYPNIVTLAVGDGANDTEMITAANIGIGISGVEGTAATNASDYAVGTFRMLHTLLFVHGFWCYKRVAILVNFMFYKAALLSFSNFFFGGLSGFSGQQLFVEILYQLYNVVFTAMPIVVLGVIDRALPAQVLDNIPEAYREAKGSRFGGVVFASWIVRSFVHSLICFFVPILPMMLDGNDILGGFQDLRGKTFGHYYFSTIQLFSISILPNLLILFFMDSITLLHIFSCVISIAMVWIFAGFFAASPVVAPEFYGHYEKVFAMPQTWLVILLSVAIPLLLELVWKFSRLQLRPTLTQVIRERTYLRSRATQDAMKSLVFEEELETAGGLHLFALHCKTGGDTALPEPSDITPSSTSASAEAGAAELNRLRASISSEKNPDGYKRARRRILQVADSAALANMMFTPDDDDVWKRQGRGQKIKVTKMDVKNREILTNLRFEYTRILRQLKDSAYKPPTRAELQTHMPLQAITPAAPAPATAVVPTSPQTDRD